MRQKLRGHLQPLSEEAVKERAAQIIEADYSVAEQAQLVAYLEQFVYGAEEPDGSVALERSTQSSIGFESSNFTGWREPQTVAEAVGNIAARLLIDYRSDVKVRLSDPYLVPLVADDPSIIRFRNPVLRAELLHELRAAQSD